MATIPGVDVEVYLSALANGEEGVSELTLNEYMVNEGIAQDLCIPRKYLGDDYMVAEHRKAHRRLLVEWADRRELDGAASAAELLFTDERFDLEESKRWGSSLMDSYDRLGLDRSFSDKWMTLHRSRLPASLSSHGQTGPHAEPEQSLSGAIKDGMRCYNLAEATSATVRFAKGQAPEMADLAIGAALVAQGVAAGSMASAPVQALDEDGNAEIEPYAAKEGLLHSASTEGHKSDAYLAKCEDAWRVFPPRFLREPGKQDAINQVGILLRSMAEHYNKIPLGLRMSGTQALYMAMKDLLRRSDGILGPELMMEIGIACSADSRESTGSIARRVAHCAGYVGQRRDLFAQGEGKSLEGLVSALVEAS